MGVKYRAAGDGQQNSAGGQGDEAFGVDGRGGHFFLGWELESEWELFGGVGDNSLLKFVMQIPAELIASHFPLWKRGTKGDLQSLLTRKR